MSPKILSLRRKIVNLLLKKMVTNIPNLSCMLKARLDLAAIQLPLTLECRDYKHVLPYGAWLIFPFLYGLYFRATSQLMRESSAWKYSNREGSQDWDSHSLAGYRHAKTWKSLWGRFSLRAQRGLQHRDLLISLWKWYYVSQSMIYWMHEAFFHKNVNECLSSRSSRYLHLIWTWEQ